MKMKTRYSFENRGTDRLNWFPNVLPKTFQMIYNTPTKGKNKVATRKRIYLPRYTRGGGA